MMIWIEKLMGKKPEPSYSMVSGFLYKHISNCTERDISDTIKLDDKISPLVTQRESVKSTISRQECVFERVLSGRLSFDTYHRGKCFVYLVYLPEDVTFREMNELSSRLHPMKKHVSKKYSFGPSELYDFLVQFPNMHFMVETIIGDDRQLFHVIAPLNQEDYLVIDMSL